MCECWLNIMAGNKHGKSSNSGGGKRPKNSGNSSLRNAMVSSKQNWSWRTNDDDEAGPSEPIREHNLHRSVTVRFLEDDEKFKIWNIQENWRHLAIFKMILSKNSRVDLNFFVFLIQGFLWYSLDCQQERKHAFWPLPLDNSFNITDILSCIKNTST